MTVRRLVLVAAAIAWSTSVMLALARHEPPVRAAEWQQSRRPVGPLFSSSDECQACHNNLTTTSGEDVSIGASWRGSMMANAARDPYFLASLRRETIDHASHAADIQEECARCHVARRSGPPAPREERWTSWLTPQPGRPAGWTKSTRWLPMA